MSVAGKSYMEIERGLKEIKLLAEEIWVIAGSDTESEALADKISSRASTLLK